MPDVDIIAGVSEKDWDTFVSKIAQVAPYVSWIHVSVSDGSMGIDPTLSDFSKLSELTDTYPHISFEARLLTANPEKYVRPLADAGFKRLIAHVESNDPRRFLDQAKFDEIEVGIAVDGATEIEEVEPFLEEVDNVVIMTAEAGEAAGTFLPEAVEKIRLIRQNFPDLPIEAVGGITDVTVKTVKEAGATRIVSTAFVLQNPDGVEEAVEVLATA